MTDSVYVVGEPKEDILEELRNWFDLEYVVVFREWGDFYGFGCNYSTNILIPSDDMNLK